MKEKLRIVLDFRSYEPYFNLAVDEALARLRLEDKICDTLRFWIVSPAVIIGYFQKVSKVVNIDYCRRNNIAILRRPSSGGAVYCDEGVLLYSLIINTSNWAPLVKYPRFSYRYLTKPFIQALNAVGVQASFMNPGMIVVDNKKISGIAQFYLYNVLLLHGTLLLYPNFSHLVNSLKNPNVPFGDKLISPSEGLLPLCSKKRIFCEKDILIKLVWIISYFFKNLFRKKIYFETLSEKERMLARILSAQKYISRGWIENKNIVDSVIL